MNRLYFGAWQKGFVFAKGAAISANQGVNQLGVVFGDRIIINNCLTYEPGSKKQMSWNNEKIYYGQSRRTQAKIVTWSCRFFHIRTDKVFELKLAIVNGET